MDENLVFISAKENGERIDTLLACSLDTLSRSAAQKLIDSGAVRLNGQPVKKNHRCTEGELFSVLLPDTSDGPPQPEDIPLDIVFEDDDVIVINKARGMVVHPAPGHPDGTLVNALLYHCGSKLSHVGGDFRPGIVHRIDKDTSGLIIAAKNDEAHIKLSAQLADRSLSRVYDAVVRGRMKLDSGSVDKPIGRHPADRTRMAVTDINSKPALTYWRLIANYSSYSHIRCKLMTGRTHQIRVHMASLGHPLLGDSLYGAPSPDKGLSGQCLHASEIKFIHPRSSENIILKTALPAYFNDVLSRLGQELY